MRSTSLMIIAGVAIVTLLFLVYLAVTFETPDGTTTIDIPATPVPVVVEPVPEPVVVPPVPVVVDVSEVVVPEVQVVLPALNESDDFIRSSLQELRTGAAFLAIVTDQQLVRRFVVFVDNVAKGGALPQTDLPYRRLQQEMPVRSVDANLFTMDATANSRFNQVVDTFVAMDPEQIMVLYRMLLPLFQEAYAEIGFRDVDFTDTLQQALRYVVSTETPQGALQMVKPSVMYLYADASIENLSDVQKQLIRLGPENSDKVKTQLRALLQQL